MDLLDSKKHFGFIGLGLIGGSVARCIRQELPKARISAYNYYETKKHPRLEMALSDGVLTDITTDITAVRDWDVIFLCTPVRTNVAYLKKLKPYLRKDCILTDVGSVKGEIYDAVHREGLDHCFIGGHPMAGTEHIGYEYSFASLLKDCYYILTPTDQVPEESIRWMQEFVQNVTRSRCVTIDVTEHDEATAGISHAPHIISAALVNAVRARDDKGMYQLLAAGGFRDITRISSSSPEMWTSICLANKDAILDFLHESTEGFLTPWSMLLKREMRQRSIISLPRQRSIVTSCFHPNFPLKSRNNIVNLLPTF